MNRLLRPHSAPCSSLTVDDFATHFRQKIDNIRQSTVSAASPVIANRSAADLTFTKVSEKEVHDLVSRLPAKHCILDPVPTWLLKKTVHIVTPLLYRMCNSSLESGQFPAVCKKAVVYPRLKKPSLDACDANSYRPISNLTFVSKLVERVVSARFISHAESNDLLPANQSAYRRCHSTETAVAAVHNDLVRAADTGHVSALVMLDLSAAFDTVDHAVLLNVLQNRFSVPGLTPTRLVPLLSV